MKIPTFSRGLNRDMVLYAKESAAHRKFERIVVQWLAAAWFYHNRGAKLKSGGEIFGDWIGLDDVNHIFLERPRLQRMGRGLRAELGRFSGFAVKHAVVGSEAAVLDDRRCG